MSKKQRLLFLSICITVTVIVLIVWFSNQSVTDSDSLSRGLAQMLVKLFFIDPSAQQLSRINHILRKLAHFTLYFILGFGLTGITSHKMRHLRLAVCISVLLGFVFAVSDELHQLFSPGRAARIQDVFLDTCGVAVGSLFLAFCKHYAIRNK